MGYRSRGAGDRPCASPRDLWLPPLGEGAVARERQLPVNTPMAQPLQTLKEPVGSANAPPQTNPPGPDPSTNCQSSAPSLEESCLVPFLCLPPVVAVWCDNEKTTRQGLEMVPQAGSAFCAPSSGEDKCLLSEGR